jgi:hypothetical protein
MSPRRLSFQMPPDESSLARAPALDYSARCSVTIVIDCIS